jgi:hypothetical protein
MREDLALVSGDLKCGARRALIVMPDASGGSWILYVLFPTCTWAEWLAVRVWTAFDIVALLAWLYVGAMTGMP